VRSVLSLPQRCSCNLLPGPTARPVLLGKQQEAGLKCCLGRPNNTSSCICIHPDIRLSAQEAKQGTMAAPPPPPRPAQYSYNRETQESYSRSVGGGPGSNKQGPPDDHRQQPSACCTGSGTAAAPALR
jgi:hypothetical protein